VTKTSGVRARTTTALGLLICLGALPSLLGLVGCRTAELTTDAGSFDSTESLSLDRPAGFGSPIGAADPAHPVPAAGVGGLLSGRWSPHLTASLTMYLGGRWIRGRTMDRVTDTADRGGEIGPQGPAGETDALEPAAWVILWILRW
jgi:hypothetical protein